MNRQQRRACKLKTAKQDEDSPEFQQWVSRNYLRVIKLTIMAEPEWQEYLRRRGIDPSQFPSEEVFVPELGIPYRQVYYPDALKKQFRVWLHTYYFPRLKDTGREQTFGTYNLPTSLPASIRKLAEPKISQVLTLIDDDQESPIPQVVTPEQKAGPFKEGYTGLLLLEVESGKASVRTMREITQTEDYLIQIGPGNTILPITAVCVRLYAFYDQKEGTSEDTRVKTTVTSSRLPESIWTCEWQPFGLETSTKR